MTFPIQLYRLVGAGEYQSIISRGYKYRLTQGILSKYFFPNHNQMIAAQRLFAKFMPLMEKTTSKFNYKGNYDWGYAAGEGEMIILGSSYFPHGPVEII